MMKELFLGLLGIALFSQSAIANGFVSSPSGAKSFIFTGLSPNQSHSVRIIGWPRDRSVTPNACGLTVIKPSSGASILQLAFPSSLMIDVASLPVLSLPACSGGQLAEPRPSNFKTAEGSVILVSQSAGSVRVIEDTQKVVKSNNCGMAKLNQPKSTFNGWWLEGTAFQVANQNLYADDLLSSQEMSICRKIGNQFIKYVPF